MKNQDYRLHTQRKNNQSLSSVSSSTPVAGIFESRPFVVQQKQQTNSQQPDLKASLMGAESYGHHLGRIKPAGISTGTQIQAKVTRGDEGEEKEHVVKRVGSEVVQRIKAPLSAVQSEPRLELKQPLIRSLETQPAAFGEIQLKPQVQHQEAAEEELHYKPSISVLQRSPTPEEQDLKNIDSLGASKKRKFGAWYGEDRKDTAYGFLSEEKRQGPHTFPHIGKRTMAESSVKNNPNFDPTTLLRTGLMPSQGQLRALIKKHSIGAIPVENQKKLIEEYGNDINNMKTGKTKKARNDAAVAVMEKNLFATYAHGRIATDEEIKGKGENRKMAAADLRTLAGLQKGASLPKNLQTFDPGALNNSGHEQTHMVKYLRDIGTVARGRAPSPFELESDNESEE